MVGTALRDVSWTNSEVSAFCLTGQEERADVRSLQSSPKSLKHLCTSLSNCNVEMSLQSYVATITSQKEGGKRKGTNFPKCLRFLFETVAFTVKKLTCFWWTRTRKIDIPFILWWPNDVWCYDNRNVTCIHFVHFTIFREFTKKLDQVPNEGENKKKTENYISKSAQ